VTKHYFSKTTGDGSRQREPSPVVFRQIPDLCTKKAAASRQLLIFIFLLDPGTQYYVPLLNCTSVCTSFLRFLFKFYKYLFDSNFYILWISSINRLFQYSVLTLYSIIRSTFLLLESIFRIFLSILLIRFS